MQKKLQVFVSSTYKDLQAERAAAVGAILSAGHMPSGMEAFAAGNAGVWDTIKEWIDACDALMLVVGEPPRDDDGSSAADAGRAIRRSPQYSSGSRSVVAERSASVMIQNRTPLPVK